MTMDRTHTVPEAAKALGVCVQRVRQLIHAGTIPARKAGRDWLITTSALESARKRRTAPGRPPAQATRARTASKPRRKSP